MPSTFIFLRSIYGATSVLVVVSVISASIVLAVPPDVRFVPVGSLFANDG